MVVILSRRFGYTALCDIIRIIRAPRICIIDALTYATKQRSATRREIRRVLLVRRARYYPVINRDEATHATPSSPASRCRRAADSAYTLDDEDAKTANASVSPRATVNARHPSLSEFAEAFHLTQRSVHFYT